MFSLHDSLGIETICDECDSFEVTWRVNHHDDSLIEYFCYDCKAEWVEYV